MNAMKKCTRCKRMLDESMFYKNRAKADGLNNECKDCAKKSVKLSRLSIKLSNIGPSHIKQVRVLCRKVYLDPDIDLILDLQQAINELVDTLELERLDFAV